MNTEQFDNPYTGVVDYEYLMYLQDRAVEECLAEDGRDYVVMDIIPTIED